MHKPNGLILGLFHWIASWLDVICGLISIITFTLYRPWWDFSFRCWSAPFIIKLGKSQNSVIR